MRFILYSLNYAPELVGIGKYNTDLVTWLTQKGHDVQVLCAPPYYPNWRVQAPFSPRYYTSETPASNLRITRCPLWVPQKPSGRRRILHLLSFALSSLPVLLWQALRFRPQVIFLVEPPIFCLPALILAAKLCGAKAWLHIQDFELDAGFALGLVPRQPLVFTVVQNIESWLMRQVSLVSTISPQMMERLQHKRLPQDRCLLLPNWVDTQHIAPLKDTTAIRRAWGIGPEQIVCLYSGSLGHKQQLELLPIVAQHLSAHPHILVLIVGQGPAAPQLAEAAATLPNLRLHDLVPASQLNALLNLADIHLLPQSAQASDLVMPSKLKAMFASGRPTIATAFADTQVGEALRHCGLIVPPGDDKALAGAICQLAADPTQRARLGAAARQYAITHWDRTQILTQLEQVLQQQLILPPRSPAEALIPSSRHSP